MGRSRGGLTSKIHALVDTNGLPVRVALTPGEAHDNRLAGKLLSCLKPGAMLLADRGYDADWIRELAMKKGAWANIPPKSNRSEPICFSPSHYRARNRVERFFNKIKQCRRVATSYDKLAANYLAFVQLASIRLWLRANALTDRGVDAFIVNFGAYSHTSIALHDALKASGLPAVEVHISDIKKREPFRRKSMTAGACVAMVSGQGFQGYIEALRRLANQ